MIDLGDCFGPCNEVNYYNEYCHYYLSMRYYKVCVVNVLISHIFVPGNCVIVLGQSNFCKEWLLCHHSSYNYHVVSVAQAVLVTVSLDLGAFSRRSAGQLGHLIYADLVGPGSQLLYLQWCR